ncbi:hypothetical protein K466DRAFT_604147 [Polyporus arcularius HHB13444]|uniref:Uncharacterized protein n=1 Tax=Polyporus arcularius HHB13444 TaxID=1314778 RepID=A0A5C3P0P6_9APHY|nr:hypothetical protein K466DRAFT_604147 [Polyporus arcularius HHB13444]
MRRLSHISGSSAVVRLLGIADASTQDFEQTHRPKCIGTIWKEEMSNSNPTQCVPRGHRPRNTVGASVSDTLEQP